MGICCDICGTNEGIIYETDPCSSKPRHGCIKCSHECRTCYRHSWGPYKLTQAYECDTCGKDTNWMCYDCWRVESCICKDCRNEDQENEDQENEDQENEDQEN